MNMEEKNISTKFEIRDRVERFAKTAYVTLKDHKDNFRSNPTFPSINPSTNEK